MAFLLSGKKKFPSILKNATFLAKGEQGPLGEIKDIQFCTLLTFPILHCIQVKIDSLRGLEDLKFVQFKILREQDTLHVILGVIFGIPQANPSLSEIRVCSSTSKI